MQHWSTIQIDNFSGPLDLLLTMIQAKKMRIEDIDLITITNQYLAYLKAQQSLDLEIASEYLAIAAQLVEMKSWALLPKTETTEVPKSYQEFFNRLGDYEAVRQQAQILAHRYQDYRLLKSKEISNWLTDNPSLKPLKPLNIQPDDLKEIFLKAWFNKQSKVNWIDDSAWMEEEAPTNYINSQAISPQEMTARVLSQLETDPQRQWKWDDLELNLNPSHNIKNLIALFLVLLDLVHYQVITMTQIEETLFVQFTLKALEDKSFTERIRNQFDDHH